MICCPVHTTDCSRLEIRPLRTRRMVDDYSIKTGSLPISVQNRLWNKVLGVEGWQKAAEMKRQSLEVQHRGRKRSRDRKGTSITASKGQGVADAHFTGRQDGQGITAAVAARARASSLRPCLCDCRDRYLSPLHLWAFLRYYPPRLPSLRLDVLTSTVREWQ